MWYSYKEKFLVSGGFVWAADSWQGTLPLDPVGAQPPDPQNIHPNTS